MWSFEILLIQALAVFGISEFIRRGGAWGAKVRSSYLGNPLWVGLMVAFVFVTIVDFFMGTSLRDMLMRLFAVSALNVIITAVADKLRR